MVVAALWVPGAVIRHKALIGTKKARLNYLSPARGGMHVAPEIESHRGLLRQAEAEGSVWVTHSQRKDGTP